MALSGNEIVLVQGIAQNNQPSGQQFATTTAAIADLASSTSNVDVITPLNTVGAGTITAAAIIGKNTQRGGAQLSAAFTDTTDTANAITAALPVGAAVGTAFNWTYINLTNAPATLTGGSGVTVSNITLIPPNSFADYLVSYSAISTYTFAGKRQGFFPHSGTVTITGATPVTVADANITTYSQVSFTLRSVGGTVGAKPAIKTITAGTGFTVSATTADVSVYNYSILG